MNKYDTPEIKVITLSNEDVITASTGDTPTVEWEW